MFVLWLDSQWFLTWARSSGWHLVCSHHCCPVAVGGEVAARGDALAGFTFVSASLEWQQEEWRNEALCFQGSDIPLCACDRGRKVSFGWTQGRVQILEVQRCVWKSKGTCLLQARLPEEEHPCPWMTQKLIHKGDNVGGKENHLFLLLWPPAGSSSGLTAVPVPALSCGRVRQGLLLVSSDRVRPARADPLCTSPESVHKMLKKLGPD